MTTTARTVVSAAEWQEALADLRVKEKENMRARDALAAQRRRLPMVEFRDDYAFDGPGGTATLRDLFDGRSQLIVYHFMFEAGGTPCTGCSSFTDNVGHLAHLQARDTSFALVSRAPQAELQPFRARMGWEGIPWYSAIGEGFQTACGITTGFGLSVFLRAGDAVYRTYFTTNRGVEGVGSVWGLLDLTPYGRQETWEDAPAGTPQTEPYSWWRLHDEYERVSS
ncbi:MAG TPA: DUF899 domain-containing protein [Baekduia sp.]|nr:DUF899 domain-containing protein [Baekduia sp.]